MKKTLLTLLVFWACNSCCGAYLIKNDSKFSVSVLVRGLYEGEQQKEPMIFMDIPANTTREIRDESIQRVRDMMSGASSAMSATSSSSSASVGLCILSIKRINFENAVIIPIRKVLAQDETLTISATSSPYVVSGELSKEADTKAEPSFELGPGIHM